MTQKVFRAAKNGSGVTADTPRAAAQKFFASFPKARKCSVFEGELETHAGVEYFVQRVSAGVRLGYWPDVTRKTAEALPS